jgi:hypothetical protein
MTYRHTEVHRCDSTLLMSAVSFTFRPFYCEVTTTALCRKDISKMLLTLCWLNFIVLLTGQTQSRVYDTEKRNVTSHEEFRLLGCYECDSCKNQRFARTYRLHYQSEKNGRARKNVSSNLQLKLDACFGC